MTRPHLVQEAAGRGARRRAGISMLEVLAAVTILALVGAPFLGSMVSAKRSAYSSGHDVRAVMAASRTMEKLLGVPYARLPAPRPDAAPDLQDEVVGVARARWAEVFPDEGGARVDLVALLGDSDAEGQETYLWFEDVAPDEVGVGDLLVREVTVAVRYLASGPKVEARRTYALRTVVTEEVGR